MFMLIVQTNTEKNPVKINVCKENGLYRPKLIAESFENAHKTSTVTVYIIILFQQFSQLP